MKKVLLICLLLLSNQSYAEEQKWFLDAIKVDNPNQLAYWLTNGDSCPITKKEVQKIIEGVFVRSRIKPLSEQIFNPGLIHLSIYLDCIKRTGPNDLYIYDLDIQFGQYNPYPAVLFNATGFGRMGIQDKEGIANDIKSSAENAVTVFIKANFNL
jgi:hypothetical protein